MAKLIPVEVFDLIIFGGTGDLAMRKLLPALYHRHRDGQFTGDSRIIAAGRSALSRKKYLDNVRQGLKDNLAEGEFDAGQWFGNPGQLQGSAYIKDMTAGFAANGNFAEFDQTQWGAALSYNLTDKNTILCRMDDLSMGNGLMLPAGPLREPRNRLNKVDVTINRDSDEVIESLGEVWNLSDPARRRHISEFQGRQVHALAGIGFPEIFFASLMQMGIDVIEHEFPDHHEFDAQDLNLKPDLPILVTHKDAVKLKGLARESIWVVPLSIELSEELSSRILQLLESRHHG